MLAPIQDKTEPGSQDIYLLYESFARGSDCVITIVASIKPWCHEWRVYWMAFDTMDADDEERLAICKRDGHKVDAEVGQAMFPHVEHEYGVHWAR